MPFRGQARSSRLALLPALLLVFGWVTTSKLEGRPGTVTAGAEESFVTSDGFQNGLNGLMVGQVTNQHGRALEIDGREYVMSRDVAIRDDENRQREPKELQPGAFVRYAVRQNEIVQLILVLPK